MTKNLNLALKVKGVVRRVAHAKSSDPATPPPKKKNLERTPFQIPVPHFDRNSTIKYQF